MKFLLNLALFNAFIFVVSLFWCSSKAIPATNIASTEYSIEQQVSVNAQFTYRTIVPFHDRLSEQYKFQTLYVVFAPNPPLVLKHDATFVSASTDKIANKQPRTFFEKATLFNDRLQSWLN